MSQGSISDFFSTPGGKTWSWKDRPIGATITGTIVTVAPPQQQVDYTTKAPLFKKNGEPKMQVRIDLQTAERDPEDPEDDGIRSLYVQGWMQGAVADALKQHKITEPVPGATLSVTLSERTPNENKMLAPYNKFTAVYTPGPVTGGYFAQGQPPAAAPVQQTIPAPAAVAAPQPVKPAAISDAAWAAMDDATKATVASTMAASSGPPF